MSVHNPSDLTILMMIDAYVPPAARDVVADAVPAEAALKPH